TSPYVHLVSHALTRTQSTRSPQSWFLMASTDLARADSFSRGATESSRSMNTMSAAMPGALLSIFSLEPGTERQDRRGRFRVRSDMNRSYGLDATPGEGTQVAGTRHGVEERLRLESLGGGECAAAGGTESGLHEEPGRHAVDVVRVGDDRPSTRGTEGLGHYL